MEKRNINLDTELKDEELDEVSGGGARPAPRSVPPFSDEGSDEGQGKAPQGPNN